MFNSLGISPYDSSGQYKSLNSMLDEIADKWHSVNTNKDSFNQFNLLVEFMSENNINQDQVLEILKWHLNK